ncbi:hypothetical protein [Streptomyces sp. NPDC002671]
MTVLVRQDVQVHVDFYGFALQEHDDMAAPVPYPEERAESDEGLFLTTHEMRVDIESGEDHREAWEAPGGEAEICSTTGRLSIEACGGPMAESLELGSPGTLWKIRVYCTGRAEVARLAHLEVPRGIERYVVQFWPASA